MEFLDSFEKNRGNSIQTRNARLAAIRSFFRLVALREPDRIELAAQVLAIPVKRADHRLIGYLARPEMEAILAAPDTQTWTGRRDYALLLMLYNTGARIAALAGPPRGRALVLIDPPYTSKQEWTDAARAMERIRGTPSALWYPIKALTRPRALIAELAKLGVHGTAVELHWTPLRLRRERLNGAGLILASVPPDSIASLCAALPELGAALQTHGEWGAVQIGF